jgi:hypothetical protein
MASLEGEIGVKEGSMFRNVVAEITVAVVGVETSVAEFRRELFGEFATDNGLAIPGEVGTDTETSAVASCGEEPLFFEVPLPAGTDDGIHPFSIKWRRGAITSRFSADAS